MIGDEEKKGKGGEDWRGGEEGEDEERKGKVRRGRGR